MGHGSDLIATCPATSAHMGPKTKSAHLLRWHYRERVTMGQFSNSFPKQFSYLCEYAFRFDLSCIFCEYPFIFHCLHCSPSCFDPDSLLPAHLWLGLSWIDSISANKRFSSPKTSSRKPYTSSKQQERQKHIAETTINLSPAPGPVGRPGRPSVSNPWGVGYFLSLGRPTCARCTRPLGSCSPVCSRGLLCCVCGVLGRLAPVHRCARSVCCVAFAVSSAPWLPFTGVPPRCVVLCVRCPGPLSSCSPVRPLGMLPCVRGVLGHLAPVHRCACSVFWFCLCGVLGHLAPVHRCARSVCRFVCAVSWASWFLFTGVPGRGVPSLCCPRGTCVCGVLALVAPVHRCARCLRCVCAVGGCVPLPPPLVFVFLSVFFSFLKSKKKGGRAYTAGTGTDSWCSAATVLCSLACVVGALAAVAPQGCGSRVLMYTGMGQGGFG